MARVDMGRYPIDGGSVSFDAAQAQMRVHLRGDDDLTAPELDGGGTRIPPGPSLDTRPPLAAPEWALQLACGTRVARILCWFPGLTVTRARLSVLSVPMERPADRIFELVPAPSGGGVLWQDGIVVAKSENPRDLARDMMARLAELVLTDHPALILLHAAALVIDGVPLVLVAPSGGGKTTLACALQLAGGSLVSDDTIAVSAKDFSLAGVPTGLRVRPGGWTLVADDLPAGLSPTLTTPAGSRVIAPQHIGPTATQCAAPAAIIILYRQAGGGRPRLTHLNTAEGLTGIIAAGASATGMVDAALCSALSDWGDRTTFLWFDYDRLDEGVAHLVAHARHRSRRHLPPGRPVASADGDASPCPDHS